MSYRIEYQYAVFPVLPAESGLDTPRFVVAIEGGDNNVWESGRRKRARDWSVDMIGTAEQVLKQAVRYAAACEGGSLKPLGRDATPEAYIARIRRLLEEAVSPTGAERRRFGVWTPRVQVPLTATALLGELAQLGIEVREETEWRQTYAVATLTDRLADFFRLVERYAAPHGLSPWAFATVAGLPES